MDPLLTFVILLIIWFAILAYLYKKGIAKKGGSVSLWGPALMIKTQRGKKFLENIGKNRFWRHYANFGIVLSFFIMIFVFFLLLWQAYIVTTIPPSRAPNPQEAIGLPGINPIIPVGYGILALIVAVVLHEFSHGFLVAYHKLKIISIGILLFIVPIGAFVEPDEDRLFKAERKKRMRVFAAGPTTNIILAIIFLIIFFAMMNTVSVKQDGLYVANVYSGMNSKVFVPGDMIVEVNGEKVNKIDAFYSVNAPNPGENVPVKIYSNGFKTVNATSGVFITSVVKGYPAYNAHLQNGWIFYSINHTIIKNEKDFFDALNSTKAGQTVEIVMLDEHLNTKTFNITLADKYDYYSKYAPSLNKESYKGKGFLGIGAAYLGINIGDPHLLKDLLSNPYGNIKGFGDFFTATFFLIGLPFAGLMPFPQSLENIFLVPFPGFWIVANSIYWIFWINLMLGLTNLLPAVPLDGGYLFKDLIEGTFQKLKMKNPEKKAMSVVSTVSLLVFILIIWQFLGPRI